MTISTLLPLSCGNAVRLVLTPPAEAWFWRILRRTADAFTGPDDAGAVRVAEDSTNAVVLDVQALSNGTPYYYRAYFWDGASWTASPSQSAIPAATYQGDDRDPRAILRDRLAAGLAVEIARGALTPAAGSIPVLTTPIATLGAVPLPAVSVGLESVASLSLSKNISSDQRLPAGGWRETSGWVDKITLAVVGVSGDAEERHALQRAIRRVILVNLPVFEALGLDQIEFSQSDDEDLISAAAPLYRTTGHFDCVAPSVVSDTVGSVADVVSTLNTGT